MIKVFDNGVERGEESRNRKSDNQPARSTYLLLSILRCIHQNEWLSLGYHSFWWLLSLDNHSFWWLSLRIDNQPDVGK
jgi:hypothetical protein